MRTYRLKHNTGETLLMLDKITHIKYSEEDSGNLQIYFVDGTYDSYSEVEEKYYLDLFAYIELLDNTRPQTPENSALVDLLYESTNKELTL